MPYFVCQVSLEMFTKQNHVKKNKTTIIKKSVLVAHEYLKLYMKNKNNNVLRKK